MRYLLLALCIALPLSACQDTQGPPPTFAPNIQELFEEYMAEQNPELFVVSTDGQAAYYTYCHISKWPICSDSSQSYPAALRRGHAFSECEKNSRGVPCKTYAVGRRIVWKGTPAPSSQTPKATLG